MSDGLSRRPDHSDDGASVNQHYDVVVVGAGPAGLNAARAAAQAGARVAVFDDNPRVGGQVWRQGPRHAPLAPLREVHAALQGLLDVTLLSSVRVVGLLAPRALLLESAEHGGMRVSYGQLILATGARGAGRVEQVKILRGERQITLACDRIACGYGQLILATGARTGHAGQRPVAPGFARYRSRRGRPGSGGGRASFGVLANAFRRFADGNAFEVAAGRAVDARVRRASLLDR
jgi:hypothetical protein